MTHAEKIVLQATKAMASILETIRDTGEEMKTEIVGIEVITFEDFKALLNRAILLTSNYDVTKDPNG